MPRVIAITCVRMGSERLPGKMLRAIVGRPLLGYLLDRMRMVRHIDGVTVATSSRTENDAIEQLCRSEGVSCFRGSEEDVLGRVLGALEQEKADVGVIAYGDGPLIDPALMDQCLERFLADPALDFVGNDVKEGFPSGMFAEAFSARALRDAAARTQDPLIREHATLFLRKNPALYRTVIIEAEGALRRPEIHLDIDEEADVRVITAIAEHFAPRQDFSLGEILAFLDAHPDLAEMNSAVHRRWKQYQQRSS
ncbi:MAG: NTP transferase domain-containing protein [Candidatus Peregrinibacteria bacterium]